MLLMFHYLVIDHLWEPKRVIKKMHYPGPNTTTIIEVKQQ